MNKFLVMAVSFLMLNLCYAADFVLIERGRPASSIVLGKDAGPVVKHAAEEFAAFLAKISGGARPAIDDAPTAGKNPVFLKLTDNPEIASEGFMIEAEKAAKSDPDPRALKHVQFDKKLYNDTWVAFRKEYIGNYRELRAYPKASAIRIDGVIDDPDWKNADIVSEFKTTDSGKKADPQTFVRITYEPENIYFVIEAMEPRVKDMVTEIKSAGGNVWEDNTLEIFISHPDMGNSYFQFIYNADCVLFEQKATPGSSADRSFTSHGEARTAVLGDRWNLELRIPTAALGEKCFQGQNWKINIMRVRKLKDGTAETSTWSSGTPHDVGTFHPVVFSAPRGVARASLFETDSRMWKNGSFTEIHTPKKILPQWILKDSAAPKDWNLAHRGVTLEMVKQDGTGDNYFVRLKDGFIFQKYGMPTDTASPKKFKVHFRAKGHGTLNVFALLYAHEPYRFLRSDKIQTVQLNSDEWQYFKYEYDKTETDVTTALAMQCLSGEIDFDDVIFYGMQEQVINVVD